MCWVSRHWRNYAVFWWQQSVDTSCFLVSLPALNLNKKYIGQSTTTFDFIFDFASQDTTYTASEYAFLTNRPTVVRYLGKTVCQPIYVWQQHSRSSFLLCRPRSSYPNDSLFVTQYTLWENLLLQPITRWAHILPQRQLTPMDTPNSLCRVIAGKSIRRRYCVWIVFRIAISVNNIVSTIIFDSRVMPQCTI